MKKQWVKTVASIAMVLAIGFGSTHALASPYTWTNKATGSQNWTVGANWSDSAPFVSGSGNELIFFADITTLMPYNINQTITSVPSTLSMNTLTLNGKGPNSTAGFLITIGDSSSTWTIGDGTTSTVNLNSVYGGGGADRDVRYTVAANLTLNQAITTFTGDSSSATGADFSGNITQAAAGYGITKSGTSLLILSGANNYSGTTTVNGGTLRLGSAALPGGIGVAGGTSALTINNAVVDLAGDFQRNLGTGSAQFQITGGTSGFSAYGGALNITVNNNANQELVWGTATFNPSTLVLNASTADSALTLANKIDLNAATRTVVVNASTAVISGDIQTSSGTGSLTKSGGGTLVLAGSNTYNGTTTISGGILSGGPDNDFGSSAGIVLNGGTLRINGTSVTNTASLGHSVTFSSHAGFDIADADNTFTVGQAMNQGTGQFYKRGDGTLVLKGANTFTGFNYVYGGTLVLDYSVEDNAKLANNRLYFYGGDIVLRGGSHSETVSATYANETHSSVSISRDGGTATIDLGAVSFGENSSIAVSEDNIAKTSTTTVNGIFSYGRMTVSSNFATLSGSDIVAYTGYTTYTDGGGGGNYTTVNEWCGAGALGSSLQSYALKIVNTGNSDVLDIGAYDLQVDAGATEGSAYLYAGGYDDNFTINGTGKIWARYTNRGLQMNVYSGTLTVNCKIKQGGNSALTKTGGGTLVLGAANDHTSPTYVSDGVVRVANSGALANTSAGTIVKSGAALELINGIDIGAEGLTLSGSGISDGGALRSLSGDNRYGGDITVTGTGPGRINSDSGTLALTGDISGPANDITFGGAGNITISNATVTAGSVTKDGAGTLGIVMADTSSPAVTCGGMAVDAGSLQLTFDATPNESEPVIKVLGDLTFVGTPTLDITLDGGVSLGSAGYPLVVVYGDAPSTVPTLTGNSGRTLAWGGTNNKTLLLVPSSAGTVFRFR